MIKVNGKDLEFQDNLTFKDFLETEGYNLQRIALELNGNILPKSQFASTVIKDEDQIEIVCFVGGG